MTTLCQIGEDGSIKGRWVLGSQPFVVGRDEAADGHVEDETASRRHAVILREGNQYIIEDLGSQNGTWVDGRRLFSARLGHNAQILIGRTRFVFFDQPATAITVVQAPQRLTGSESPVLPEPPALPATNRGETDVAKRL